MLIRKILSLLIVALMVPLTGCATRGGPVSYDTAAFTTPDAVRPDLTGSGIIGKLDVLAVNVYQLPELNRDYQVDTDGNIVMPLVGSVKADGLSATDLARDISARLAARYVRSPSVTVGIKQTAVQTVTVEGAVNRPGMFPIPGKISLLRAVALAAGPSQDANIKRVVIFRQIEGKRAAAAFDLSLIRTGQAPDPEVFGNDIVVLDGSGLNQAYREILQAIPLLYIFNTL